MTNKKHIVILGGGFAGVYSALSIAREAGASAEVTIINRTNYFLFTPMLHEVATGGLGHHQVVESIRQIISKTKIRFIESDVVAVDTLAKTIQLTSGDQAYDMLVVAIGATTNFFGTKGAEEHAYVLKTLSDAITLRDQVIERFEAASRETDGEAKKKLLSFVIVGGGATGVEYAAELAELCNNTLRDFYKKDISCEQISITLVNSGKELLSPFSPKTRIRAERSLKKHGVRVLLNTKVSEVTESSVVLGDGTTLPAGMVVWAAGVKPNTLATNTPLPLDPGGRIQTERTLAVVGQPDIYALGDVAAVPDANGKPFPTLAQVAVAEAKFLGKNIALRLAGKTQQNFAFATRGELVSLGKGEAAGTIAGIDIYGTFAWFIWRTVYLFKFISHSKRIKIAFDWTMQLFYSRDITRS